MSRRSLFVAGAGVFALVLALVFALAACGAGTPGVAPRPPAPPLGAIAGIVVGTDGAPVAGAPVTCASARGARRTTTDRGGRFELALPPGAYRLAVDDGQFFEATGATDIVLAAGEHRAGVALRAWRRVWPISIGNYF